MCVQRDGGALCPAVGPRGPWLTPLPLVFGRGRLPRVSGCAAPGSGEDELRRTLRDLFAPSSSSQTTYFSPRLSPCLPASASRLSGEDDDRFVGVIGSEE